MLGQSSPKLSGPLTAVFIEGISKPNDCGVRFVADFLEDEFKFPTINVVNVAYFGGGLSELIIPVASPSLQAALAGSSVAAIHFAIVTETWHHPDRHISDICIINSISARSACP